VAPPATEAAPLPERGTLAHLPLPRILLALHRARWTGALELVRERTRKRIVFQAGAPILAESNLASETLGVLLLDRGQITRDDYARIVGRVQETGCKEGKALLDLRLLEPKALFVALKDQLRRRILEGFAWASGDYALDAGETPPADAGAFRLDAPALVLEGLVLHWSADRLFAALAERLPRRLVPGPAFASLRARLPADPGVEALAAALDGTRTLADAVRTAGVPSALAAAWLFDVAGVLEQAAEAPAPAGPSPAEAVREAAPEIEVVVGDGEPAEDGVLAGARAKAGASALPPDAEALRREILERHAALSELDHYALLGVPRSADAATLKRAYFRAAKRYHPDALARLGLSELRAAAEALFARIAKAHAVLADPRERQRYDEGDDAGSDDAERLATAENLYRKGEVLLRKGAFREALQFLSPAAELWPEDAAYQGALGWALYKQPKSDPGAARAPLEAAVRLDPKNAVILFRLGTVLRALGHTAEAESAFARARALDPKASA